MAKWFYSRGNQTYGPFPAEQIKAWAAKELLRPEDRIWQEGDDRKNAIAARAALEFQNLPSLATPLPDWLVDVASSERIGPIPPLSPCIDVPEWMNDLRLWYGLEAMVFTVAPQPTRSLREHSDSPLPIPCAYVPDWLAELLPEAKPLAIQSPPAFTSEIDPARSRTAASDSAPIPSPAVMSDPSLLAPAEPQTTERVEPSNPAVGPLPRMTVAHLTPSWTILKPAPVDLFAQKAIDETGFDPRSGEIVNVPQFQKWKQEKASPGATADSPTNALLMEAFRKGRTAIENWVDHEDNKTLVLQGDAATIQANSQLAAILAEFEKFGPVMRQKLQAHLAFMIDNRRKYHAAYVAMFGSAARAP